ncbi:helix-turn-helix transcriptional regulator [Saccharopolyspora sp. MS10]|uniref:helix-turn-helix transcriptional regulator n=1 Tax=Saccharopolyspora sp. MS10 TaxID=3385973 RepID=UPI0039A3D99E
MTKRDLGDFLRSRRELRTPAAAGLPSGRHRRTPGLRREEVAALAGVSVNYYERLEQARGPHPSPQVVDALATALGLSAAEREHLSRLAEHAPSGPAPSDEVPEPVRLLLERIGPVPAYVLNARHDVLAWNPAAAALLLDFAALPPSERNILRLSMSGGPLCCESTGDGFTRHVASELRQAVGRHPADERLRELVRDLAAHSAEFAAHWREQELGPASVVHKRLRHPELGLVEVDLQELRTAGHDHRVVLVTAEPGSASAAKLAALLPADPRPEPGARPHLRAVR